MSTKLKRENVKKLVWGFFLILFLYWIGDGITPRMCFVYIGLVVAYFIYMINEQGEKLNAIKKKLQQKENEYEYKMEVEISLKWNEIIEKIIEDKQLIKSLWKQENKRDIQKKYDDGDCLFMAEDFRFIKFYNSKTNISTVWSDHDKKFLKEVIAIGKIFPDNTPFAAKISEVLESGNYQPQFRITPNFIGFSKWPFISEIPFRDIVSLLLEIGKNIPGKEMNGIKKFPLSLQKEFDKYNVRYFTDYNDRFTNQKMKDTSDKLVIDSEKFKEWANNQGLVLSRHKVDCHIFETDLYSIYITMQCYFSEESTADVWS